MTLRLPVPTVLSLLLLGPLAATAAPRHDHGAHEHGRVALEIALDGPTLTIGLEAPLDSLLGFERAPRTEAEKKAAQAVLADLRAGAGLIVPDAAAQCQPVSTTVDAPTLQGGAAAAGEHADLDATFVLRCARPQALASLDLGSLLDRFRRIARVEAEIVAPAGQFKAALQRPARVLRWGR
ncbi:ZrgA family zinc uptake protein [Sphaerotilus uruguayifluvii]|uniref:DUF2796 domain-containing protein n=1 Tax=Sphaerotilus uruguayifluvii TaxID=2735897 RepID=A0ABX2G9N4_9BURK|nr:DUF2796 domain-containing protein [Leptothrix sp. C29]NRT58193.1 hypothetical protein [Leptothrix sp. C29]